MQTRGNIINSYSKKHSIISFKKTFRADLAAQLAFVQDRFLAGYAAAGEKTQINLGEIIRQPVLIEDTYGVQKGTDLDGKTFLAVGSTVGTVLELELNTAFQIIAQILYNSDASPMKKAIVEAGLGKDFGGLFLDHSSFTTIMMTYLIGSEPSHLDRFREVYRQTLSRMVAEGLDRDLVLSELNKFEFSVREDMTKAQRGLDLIARRDSLSNVCDAPDFSRPSRGLKRNAMAPIKAINAARLALAGDGSHRVSLDKGITTMRQTGADMSLKYTETTRGGLAVNIIEC